MVRRPLQRRWMLLLGLLSFLVLILGYTYLAYREQNLTIPTWAKLWKGVQTMVSIDRAGDRWLVVDSVATAKRFFIAMGISVVGAILIGVHMGSVSVLEGAALPLLSLLAKVVPTAAIAVFFVLFGTELEMFVGMIVFGIMPSMAISIYLAVKDVPEELIHKSYTLGASHMEVIWFVVFPSILPKVFDAIRLQIGPALVFLVAAEVAVGDVGFGYRIRLLMRRLDMTVIYPYLAILAGFGFLMDYSLRGLRAWLCPWYKEGRS
ncbi:MAG: ABC transporter permease subunit [Proteobacteria bacterium]|nr:ABC transporter permease subunit [Pseudomonadota bacterium]